MGRKIVNLDDQKNTLEITMGGKTWEITRIVLKMRELYGEYFALCSNYLQRLTDKDVDDEKKLELAEDYAKDKADYLDLMMTKILSDNGYEYDKDWWAENVADYQTIEQFVVACMSKDQDEDKKKAEGVK